MSEEKLPVMSPARAKDIYLVLVGERPIPAEGISGLDTAQAIAVLLRQFFTGGLA
jgi:hypothetical protein